MHVLHDSNIGILRKEISERIASTVEPAYKDVIREGNLIIIVEALF
jgi:hypothetical protein